jgi:hypothetical protein
MPTRIDHIVIGVRDLAHASAHYAAAGFIVTPGGEHTGERRTHNALIAFADTTYLELIAYRDPDIPRGDDPWWQLLTRGEGFLGFALRMEDASAEASALQSRGVSVRGPFTGGRERPDRQRVAWRTIEVERSGPVPFLIEDLTPRWLRIPDGAATQHPLGVARLLELALVVEDLVAPAAAFAALLGSAGAPLAAPMEGVGAALRFTIGPHIIDLLTPAGPESALGRALGTHGPGLYAVTLGDTDTHSSSHTETTLPLAQTHGARIGIVEATAV